LRRGIGKQQLKNKKNEERKINLRTAPFPSCLPRVMSFSERKQEGAPSATYGSGALFPLLLIVMKDEISSV